MIQVNFLHADLPDVESDGAWVKSARETGWNMRRNCAGSEVTVNEPVAFCDDPGNVSRLRPELQITNALFGLTSKAEFLPRLAKVPSN